jgi:hypothetical protein
MELITVRIIKRIVDYSIVEVPDIKSLNLWKPDDSMSYLHLINYDREAYSPSIEIANKNFIEPEIQEINLLTISEERFNISRNISEEIDLLKMNISDDPSKSYNPEYYFEKLKLLQISSIQERIVSLE